MSEHEHTEAGMTCKLVERVADRDAGMQEIHDLIVAAGGTMDPQPPTVLPDGSAVMTASFPLPTDHWLFQERGPAPMPFRMLAGGSRKQFDDKVVTATRWAVQATLGPNDPSWDPDALVMNMLCAMRGYGTEDGLDDLGENPSPIPSLFWPDAAANRAVVEAAVDFYRKAKIAARAQDPEDASLHEADESVDALMRVVGDMLGEVDTLTTVSSEVPL